MSAVVIFMNEFLINFSDSLMRWTWMTDDKECWTCGPVVKISIPECRVACNQGNVCCSHRTSVNKSSFYELICNSARVDWSYGVISAQLICYGNQVAFCINRRTRNNKFPLVSVIFRFYIVFIHCLYIRTRVFKTIKLVMKRRDFQQHFFSNYE